MRERKLSKTCVPSALRCRPLSLHSDCRRFGDTASFRTVPARCGVRDTRNDMASACSATILAERLRHTTCINGAPLCRTRLHVMFREVSDRITVVAARMLLVRGFTPPPDFATFRYCRMLAAFHPADCSLRTVPAAVGEREDLWRDGVRSWAGQRNPSFGISSRYGVPPCSTSRSTACRPA